MYEYCIIIILLIIIILVLKKENFYTSGASLREKSEVSESTQKTIDQDDYAQKYLSFYMKRPTY